ncbi:MAG: hypothetical protein KIT09_24725 [Bryobacteraceae bacterium]|nr:hypothetical protein [Bryobacteraceae bacterium]
MVRYEPGRASVRFGADSIVNGASFRPGLPHPGGLASIFAQGLDVTATIVAGPPLPLELAGVSILVDGHAAPILAVTDLGHGRQQINFQVPFEAESNRVEVRYKGLSTFAIPRTVAPGIFTLPTGDAAILHADYSLVTASNPARPGEVLIVYATGLGPVKPAVETGAAAAGPAMLDPPCAYRSDLTLYAFATQWRPFGSIEYAGAAPGYPGLYQLNVRVPDIVQAGTRSLSLYWYGCWPLGPPEYEYAMSNAVPLHVQ